MSKTYLELAEECDNFPYYHSSAAEVEALSAYYEFKLHGVDSVLGHIPTEIAKCFPITDDWERDDAAKTFIFRPQGGPADAKGALEYRNQILAAYLQSLRERKIFEVLSGWRDECYPIYGPGKQMLLSMERSATPLFGVVTYGVHMTAFVRTSQGIKLWTPKRSETKQTYPGMMDNTVAGGLSTGEKPGECLIRESMEEASLSEDVAKNAKPCGTLTYHYLRGPHAGGETGLSQPECQYIYDLELSEDIVPQPNDKEAVDFQALTISEVEDALVAGKFKPNCALLLLEFLVRHGVITAENEPDYIELVSRFHRRLGYPVA